MIGIEDRPVWLRCEVRLCEDASQREVRLRTANGFSVTALVPAENVGRNKVRALATQTQDFGNAMVYLQGSEGFQRVNESDDVKIPLITILPGRIVSYAPPL